MSSQTHNLKPGSTQPQGLWASHGPTYHFKLRHRAAQGPLLAVHKRVCEDRAMPSGPQGCTHTCPNLCNCHLQYSSQSRPEEITVLHGTLTITPSSLGNRAKTVS